MTDSISQVWSQEILTSLGEVGSLAASLLPNLAGALGVLLLGWLVAKLLRAVVSRTLKRIGADNWLSRFGGEEGLQQLGLETTLSAFVGQLVFWVLMLVFLLSASDLLGLTAVTATLERLFNYLPRVISAAIIVVLGMLLARFVGNLVGSAATAAELAYGRQLGSAARVAIVVMVFVIVFEQLGVDTQILRMVISAFVGMLALGLGLSFALGSRDVVRGILASHYLRQTLEEGQEVEVSGRRGRVERIGPIDTLFKNDEQAWSVPNVQLMNEVVVR